MTAPPLSIRAAINQDIAVADVGPVLFELSDVSFVAEGRTLLQPLSTTLPAKRVVGLIGHNGSGKSTLLKLLARQQQVSSGRILFEGKPLADWGDRAFARKLAYLPQQTPPAAGAHAASCAGVPQHGGTE